MNDLLSRFSTRSDLHQSSMHASLMKEIGWHVEGKSGSQIFYRTLGPLAIAKIQRPQHIDFDWLKQFRGNHHTLTTYIEPGLSTKLPPQKLGINVEPYAHSCTSLVDLAPSEQSIINSFSQKTRYNIVHTLKKNNLTTTSSPLNKLTKQQSDEFFALHESWSKQKNVIGHPIYLLKAIIKCYGKFSDLHLCYQNNELVGSLLILYHDRVATYYTALASDNGYRLYAPTLLTWTAMQTAKAKGCDIFDFGGIYDPRYPKMYKNWIGFTKFKSGFNPEVVSYPGTTLQIGW